MMVVCLHTSGAILSVNLQNNSNKIGGHKVFFYFTKFTTRRRKRLMSLRGLISDIFLANNCSFEDAISKKRLVRLFLIVSLINLSANSNSLLAGERKHPARTMNAILLKELGWGIRKTHKKRALDHDFL